MNALFESRLAARSAGLLLAIAGAASANAAELRVPAEHPTIQEAVDAASDGDSIQIASGVYTEAVQIRSRKLTLIGQPGTILRATDALPEIVGSPASQFPIMYVWRSEVTVRGLTFEGERLAGRYPGPGDMKGLYLWASSATVEDCAFYGFRESVPGPENAIAITATGFGTGVIDLRVAGCTFADNYNALFVIGLPDRQTVNVTIENNVIIGPGPLDRDWNDVGIAIREGVGGRVAGNTVSGYSYTGTKAEFDISFGILADNEAFGQVAAGSLQPLVIEGNTLRDNQIHIALIKGDASVVRDNRFAGSAPGILPLGLAASGTNVTIANNRFEDMPEGIRLLGNDPMFGTLLGAAVDAQVSSNRFCNVAKPVNAQPLSSATQQGTLLCPFPAPELAIEPAVIVSWPGMEEGGTVEAATNAEGPWAAVEATPFMQKGRHSIAAPSGGARRFFRLR